MLITPSLVDHRWSADRLGSPCSTSSSALRASGNAVAHFQRTEYPRGGVRERIAGLNGLQATQSILFAMTELCKGSPASEERARAAVRAVRQGKYRADLGTP